MSKKNLTPITTHEQQLLTMTSIFNPHTTTSIIYRIKQVEALISIKTLNTHPTVVFPHFQVPENNFPQKNYYFKISNSPENKAHQKIG